MSMKCYDAYLVKGGLPQLENILTELHTIKKNWIDLNYDHLYRILKRSETKEGFIREAKAMRHLYPDEVMIYFWKGKIVIQSFLSHSTRDRFHKKVVEKFDLEDYHYQDSSDPSYVYLDGYETFSNRKKSALVRNWEERAKWWNTLDDSLSGSFGEKGFCYSVFDIKNDNDLFQLQQEFGYFNLPDEEDLKCGFKNKIEKIIQKLKGFINPKEKK